MKTKLILVLVVSCFAFTECKSQTPKSLKSASSGSPRATAPQHIEVVKQPGDPVTIWFWNAPATSSFDGISVESSPTLGGPYTDMPLTIVKTDASVTFPAPSAITFYDPYYWKMVNEVKTKISSSMNVVEVSIGAPAPIPPEPVPQGAAPVITVR